jgi:hypothetical protein
MEKAEKVTEHTERPKTIRWKENTQGEMDYKFFRTDMNL